MAEHWMRRSDRGVKWYLCVAEVLHFLCDLGRIRSEEVLVVSQHHILDEELTHCL